MKFSASGWFSDDWYQNVEAAADHGFLGIEQLMWEDLDIPRAAETLRVCGITNSAILLASKDHERARRVGYNYGMVHEDARGDIVEAFRETAEAAQELGTPNVVVVTGLARDGISRETQHMNCVDTLREIAPIAEEYGVTAGLEPLNPWVDHAGDFLTSSAEAFDIIRAVASPRVRVLFDIYHQQISEGNLIRNITDNIDLIGHFHIADNPGRCEPGTGEINYDSVLRAIHGAGYGCWLAFECGTSVPVGELTPRLRMLVSQFETR